MIYLHVCIRAALPENQECVLHINCTLLLYLFSLYHDQILLPEYGFSVQPLHPKTSGLFARGFHINFLVPNLSQNYNQINPT